MTMVTSKLNVKKLRLPSMIPRPEIDDTAILRNIRIAVIKPKEAGQEYFSEERENGDHVQRLIINDQPYGESVEYS